MINQSIKRGLQTSQKMLTRLFTISSLFFIASGCDNTNSYFEQLRNEPEIYTAREHYKKVYGIGDTLVMYGRFQSEDLKIRIGNAEAKIIEKSNVDKLFSEYSQDSLQVIKLLISKDMGIGVDRSVRIIAAGSTISGMPIEIVPDVKASILPNSLQLQPLGTLPSGATLIYSHNNSGNIYFRNSSDKKLWRILANGQYEEVFDESTIRDSKGPTVISEFGGGGISPNEQYYYFSAKVSETKQDYTVEIYKLYRYNFTTKLLETLNRTEYSLIRSKRTLEATQPWEGKLNKVKIYKATGLYPTEDDIYVNLMENFLTKIDQNGNYSYLLNYYNSFLYQTYGYFTPRINNSETGDYYSESKLHSFLPGTKIDLPWHYIDVEKKVMYSGTQSYMDVVNINTGLTTLQIQSQGKDNNEAAYPNAALKIFNGQLYQVQKTPLAYKGKLIGLYFNGTILCEIDIEQQRSTRYAPGILESNGLDLSGKVEIFNCDANGMLYMLIGGTTLARTTYSNK